ncbi:unnamed protein product [Zymoseptoria tritici ST99CH_1A5]|uniref:Uncharacterized protein n=1 Tax=Zymoseptoria tritici ST99CH_1A5 TaxID=1276529 RepID=A0A1Y6LLX4_ZYMTR|nr:unnamed protein product [Zymoseptoria tritici ST99CH_1A5]
MTSRTRIQTRDLAQTNGVLHAGSPVIDKGQATEDSRFPVAVRFPLVVLSTFILSAVLNSVAAEYTGPELAAVSRNLTEGWQVGGLVGLKLAELVVVWYICYDYLDLAYLSLLNNVPHYFLLNTCFGIDYLVTLIPITIDIASIAIPFALLRSVKHARGGEKQKTPNQDIAQDNSVQFVTAALGASIYAFVLYSSFTTWLPTFLVVHFDGIRSMEKVHSTGIWLLLALFGPLGYAATQFIFVPAIGDAQNPGPIPRDAKARELRFDPETASLSQHVLHNLHMNPNGLTARGHILIKRTIMLAASSFFTSLTRSLMTIEGTDLAGALGWAGVWASAAGLVGLAFAWVADE